MEMKDLKIGMVVKNNFDGNLYTIIKVDIINNYIKLRLIGGTYNKNFINVCTTPCGGFFEVYSIMNNLSYCNQQHTSKSVYVVTTIVENGMEFEGTDYCGVFATLEKARKYFESEKRDWLEKLVRRYDGDGEQVTVYNVDSHTCEIYAQEDYKDCITISIVEKSVQ